MKTQAQNIFEMKLVTLSLEPTQNWTFTLPVKLSQSAHQLEEYAHPQSGIFADFHWHVPEKANVLELNFKDFLFRMKVDSMILPSPYFFKEDRKTFAQFGLKNGTCVSICFDKQSLQRKQLYQIHIWKSQKYLSQPVAFNFISPYFAFISRNNGINMLSMFSDHSESFIETRGQVSIFQAQETEVYPESTLLGKIKGFAAWMTPQKQDSQASTYQVISAESFHIFDDYIIVALCRDKCLRIWDSASGQIIKVEQIVKNGGYMEPSFGKFLTTFQMVQRQNSLELHLVFCIDSVFYLYSANVDSFKNVQLSFIRSFASPFKQLQLSSLVVINENELVACWIDDSFQNSFVFRCLLDEEEINWKQILNPQFKKTPITGGWDEVPPEIPLIPSVLFAAYLTFTRVSPSEYKIFTLADIKTLITREISSNNDEKVIERNWSLFWGLYKQFLNKYQIVISLDVLDENTLVCCHSKAVSVVKNLNTLEQFYHALTGDLLIKENDNSLDISTEQISVFKSIYETIQEKTSEIQLSEFYSFINQSVKMGFESFLKEIFQTFHFSGSVFKIDEFSVSLIESLVNISFSKAMETSNKAFMNPLLKEIFTAHLSNYSACGFHYFVTIFFAILLKIVLSSPEAELITLYEKCLDFIKLFHSISYYNHNNSLSLNLFNDMNLPIDALSAPLSNYLDFEMEKCMKYFTNQSLENIEAYFALDLIQSEKQGDFENLFEFIKVPIIEPIKGLYFLNRKSPSEALKCFVHYLSFIGKATTEVEAIIYQKCFACYNTIFDYSQSILELFRKNKFINEGIEFSKTCLLLIDDQNQRNSIILGKFLFSLELEMFEEAFMILMEITNKEHQISSLKSLITALCETHHESLLYELPFHHLERDCLLYLESKARKSDILSPTNYYKVLYGFYIFKGNFKEAAKWMVWYALRMEYTESLSIMKCLTDEAKSLLVAINALSLLPEEDAWVPQLDHGYQTKTNELLPSVLYVQDLRKKYLLKLAKLELMNQVNGLEQSKMELLPKEAIALSLNARNFSLANDLSRLFQIKFMPFKNEMIK